MSRRTNSSSSKNEKNLMGTQMQYNSFREIEIKERKVIDAFRMRGAKALLNFPPQIAAASSSSMRLTSKPDLSSGKFNNQESVCSISFGSSSTCAQSKITNSTSC